MLIEGPDHGRPRARAARCLGSGGGGARDRREGPHVRDVEAIAQAEHAQRRRALASEPRPRRIPTRGRSSGRSRTCSAFGRDRHRGRRRRAADPLQDAGAARRPLPAAKRRHARLALTRACSRCSPCLARGSRAAPAAPAACGEYRRRPGGGSSSTAAWSALDAASRASPVQRASWRFERGRGAGNAAAPCPRPRARRCARLDLGARRLSSSAEHAAGRAPRTAGRAPSAASRPEAELEPARVPDEGGVEHRIDARRSRRRSRPPRRRRG